MAKAGASKRSQVAPGQDRDFEERPLSDELFDRTLPSPWPGRDGPQSHSPSEARSDRPQALTSAQSGPGHDVQRTRLQARPGFDPGVNSTECTGPWTGCSNARSATSGDHVLYVQLRRATCTLAQFRREARGRPIMSTAIGRDDYPGNTGDPGAGSSGEVRQRFGLKRVVLVGDRGLLTETDQASEAPGTGLDLGPAAYDPRTILIFDRQAGRTLVVCHMLGEYRRRTRERWPRSPGRWPGAPRRLLAPHAEKVGRKNRYKVAKHFEMVI